MSVRPGSLPLFIQRYKPTRHCGTKRLKAQTFQADSAEMATTSYVGMIANTMTRDTDAPMAVHVRAAAFMQVLFKHKALVFLFLLSK